MEMNQHRHSELVRFSENVLKLAKLVRIIETEMGGGKVKFQTVAQPNILAMLDRRQCIGPDRIHATETNEALRILSNLSQSPVIFLIDHLSLVGHAHESASKQIRFRKGGRPLYARCVKGRNQIFRGVWLFFFWRSFV